MEHNNLEHNDMGEESQQAHDRQELYVTAQLKTAQTLLTIAVIAGPVSLVVGGVLLGSVALICAIVGYVKLKKITSLDSYPTSPSKTLTDNLRRQALIAMFVCAAALTINMIFFVQLMSMYMDYIASGDVQGLMDALYGADGSNGLASSDQTSNAAGDTSGSPNDSGSSGGSSGGSIWDK